WVISTVVTDSGSTPACCSRCSNNPMVGPPNSPWPASINTRSLPISTSSGLNGISKRSSGKPTSRSAWVTCSSGTLVTNFSSSGRAYTPSLIMLTFALPRSTWVTPSGAACSASGVVTHSLSSALRSHCVTEPTCCFGNVCTVIGCAPKGKKLIHCSLSAAPAYSDRALTDCSARLNLLPLLPQQGSNPQTRGNASNRT